MDLAILHYPHPALRHVSKPLKRVDAELRSAAAQMFELMYHQEGVGLAANQVDLPYRLFVVNHTGDPQEKESEHVFINPVLSKGKGSIEGEEGCLSLPGVTAQVARQEQITVNAYNLAGEEITADVEGFFARVLQHETDHLDGKMFFDRLLPAQLAEIRDEIEEFEVDFRSKQQCGELPSDEQIAVHLAELEQLRT